MMDTLAYVKRLRAAGVPEEQAEAHAEALNAAVQAEVATKADLEPIKTELRLHRWVLGFVVALQIATIIKLFA